MQNNGNATSAVISSITKPDGTALIGGESSIRVYLSIANLNLIFNKNLGNATGASIASVAKIDGTLLLEENLLLEYFLR